MRGLSGAGKVLVAMLAAYVLADILLTPLAGLETRNPPLVTPLGFWPSGQPELDQRRPDLDRTSQPVNPGRPGLRTHPQSLSQSRA